MLFDDRHPGVAVTFQCEDPDFEVVKLEAKNPCWHCGRPTQWVELNFEAHLCSEECVDAKWKEYFEACNKGH